MASAKIFRINYKSDFILTLESDAGWMTPFCIKFWTGVPSQAFFVGWDGETYTHCAYDPGEPTKLLVQFDDHHLPIGDLKFQIAYHFTVADFPNDTEDEVINPANIITEIDGQEYQVMLDFTGETAPEIEFSLPAYANEAQRIANEQQRIANEEQRISAEQQRINNEETRISREQTRQDNEAQRIRNEQTRINQEEARVREFATLKHDAQEATTAANDAAALANQKAQLAADKAQLAADKAALAQDAANLANQKAQLAADKAALAQDAADLANQKAQLAQQKAEYAQSQGDYAKQQGDYAKEQGDYAKRKGDDAAAQMQQQAQAFSEAQAARQTAYEQAEGTESGSVAGDGSRWGAFKTNEAARDAKVDAKVADITNLQEAVAEGAVYDVSAKNPTAGPNNDGKWGSLSALLSDANLNTLIPTAVRRGGMSIKFVQSNDNKYIRYNLIADEFTTDVTKWAIDDVGVYVENPEWIYILLDANKRILAGIKSDGSVEWSIGVPTPVKTYIDNAINEIKNGTEGTDIDGLNKIITFLSEFSTSDTLKDLLNTKVDKEEGKSLVDAEYADGVHYIENHEFVEVKLDSENKIIWAIKTDGTIYYGAGVPQQVKDFLDSKVDKEEGKSLISTQYIQEVNNPEFIEVLKDKVGHFLLGIRIDGNVEIAKAKFLDEIKNTVFLHEQKTVFDTNISDFRDTNADWQEIRNELGASIGSQAGVYATLQAMYNLYDRLALAKPELITKYDPMATEDVPATENSPAIYAFSDVRDKMKYAGFSDYPEYANGIEQETIKLASVVYGDKFPEGETDYNITYNPTPAYKTYIYKIRYNNISTDKEYGEKPSIVIFSGNHGNERMAIFDLYMLAKHLVSDFVSDENMFKILSTFNVYIVPCLNGYGIYNGTRGNGNGININRNFDAGWQFFYEQPTANTNANSGPYASSEFETNLVKAIVKSIKPMFSCDHHNYSKHNYAFYTNVPNFFVPIQYQAIQKVSYACIKNMPDYFGTDMQLFLHEDNGFGAGKIPQGMLSDWVNSVGIPGVTIEVSQRINYINGNYDSSNQNESWTKDTFKVQEYIFRIQLLLFLNEILKNNEQNYKLF